MNAKHARLIVDCYKNEIDTAFAVDDQRFRLFEKEEEGGWVWILKISKLSSFPWTLEFPVADVRIQPSAIDPENESFLVFDFGGEMSVCVFVEADGE